MSRPSPCLFRADPDVPRDAQNRRYCRCGVVEDHARHTLPTVPEQAEVRGRYEHDDEGDEA